MSHKKRPIRGCQAEPVTATTEKPQPQVKKRKIGQGVWTYILTFVLFVVFCTVVYGDVFRRAAEANFITSDATLMKFLTCQSWGWLYCIGRWILLLYKNTVVGAVALSLILTAIAILTDRLFGVPSRWKGVGTVLPAAIMGWMLWRGTNLYYKFEPSLFMLIPVIVLLAMLLANLVRRLVVSKSLPVKSRSCAGFAWGMLIPCVLFAALTFTARYWNENEILTARMQLRSQKADWDGIIEDALSARRPSRAVAAYYAIALVQTNQLLERLYDLTFDFPKVRLLQKDGSEEYGIFVADCNLYAGLINPAYRCNMDHLVINGPNIYTLKRMTMCAILNDEKALARKYLDILSHVPFEQSFVDKYTPMVNNRQLVEEDEEMKAILVYEPQEHRYENNYRSPAFLGYNSGLFSGTNASLSTAIAASIYSKDIMTCIPHIRIYCEQHGGVLPITVQQVLALAANKQPAIAKEFASYIKSQQSTLETFVMTAKPLIDERLKRGEGKSEAEKERLKHEYNAQLRKALHDDWVGTYFYYYYCENNDQNQVKPKVKSAVN